MPVGIHIHHSVTHKHVKKVSHIQKKQKIAIWPEFFFFDLKNPAGDPDFFVCEIS